MRIPSLKELFAFKGFLNWCADSFNIKHKLKYCAKNSIIEYPCRIESPKTVVIEENVNIRFGIKIINARTETVVIKRGTTIAPNVTIVTNNHVPTVGVSTFLLTSLHLNDKSTDIIVGEDVWIGVNATILAGASLGRGTVVGANAVVTKPTPPYSVVVGAPARIVATRFTKEQILKHEKLLYKEEEILNDNYLNDLFSTLYRGLRSIGTSYEFSTADFERISEMKKARGYVDP